MENMELLKVLVETGGILKCHIPQAARLTNELAEALWPGNENMKIKGEQTNG